MEMQEKLELTRHLLTFLENYKATGRLKVHAEDAAKLKQLYMELYRINANVGCPTCLLHYLEMLSSWYEKHRQPVQVNVQVNDQPTDQVEIPKGIIPKGKRGVQKKK